MGKAKKLRPSLEAAAEKLVVSTVQGEARAGWEAGRLGGDGCCSSDPSSEWPPTS